MASAKKCDRCGKLYEEYDHIECNGEEVDGVRLTEGIYNGNKYDLCPECCLEFARWLVDPNTVVELIQDETSEIDTVLYADGEKILTQKANGEIEWHNIVLENKEVSENGKC